MQAHKLILSACSPFFRSVLKQNSYQHPLLYLKGVQFTDLQAVLNFMYHGEVNVAQEELNSFLAVAEDLQVKGLTQTNSDQGEKPTKQRTYPAATPPATQVETPNRRNEEPTKPTRTVSPPIKKPVYQEPQYEDDIQEVISVVKTEPEQVSYTPSTQPTSASMEVASIQESYGEEDFDYGGYDGEEQGYEEQYEGGMIGADQNKGKLIRSYLHSRYI
jgi:hypothetical protein